VFLQFSGLRLPLYLPPLWGLYHRQTSHVVAREAHAASAKVALWLFVALLAGAFTGSFSAIYGGKQGDL